jgi:hypothetical protein
MSSDHIYWLFSAAAQSIAAFVAFLLTGYALVYTLMESARQRDETLEDIHAAMQQSYHSRLRVLAWITGAAIVLSLLSIFLNRWRFPGKTPLMVVTALLDLTAIAGGLGFVISIVNPAKYQRAAIGVLQQKKAQFKLTGAITPAHEFFTEFVKLEDLVRQHLRIVADLPGAGRLRNLPSFREMVDVLRRTGVIDEEFHEELMRINEYRNLVFHGHVDDVHQSMLQRVRMAVQKVEKLG